MDKNQTSWLKPRHRVVRDVLCALLRPYCRLIYGLQADPFPAQGQRPYLILMNHQTPFDQFFVNLSFQGPLYYLATEDVFSNGWVSSLIRWLAAPIPIKKQTTDLAAVKTCIRVAREGGTLVIAPEGNRTYSGKTEYMKPAIASLAKKLRLPVVLYRIEGGYGVQPRWSDGVRRGRIHSYVSRVIEPEEYDALSREELFAQIEAGLFVDEGQPGGRFRSSRRAEYLERALYVCPFCGLSEFESHGNVLHCKRCGRRVIYGEDKQLRGDGFSLPFEYVTQWYEYQQDFVRALEPMQYTREPLYRDTVRLLRVIVYRKKLCLRPRASVCLYGDRITIDQDGAKPLVFPFDTLSAVTVLGRNKLNLYHTDGVYQLKGGKRFNALKYVNLYYRYQAVQKGDEHGKFLGL